jgi:hypothetical protein
MAALDLIVFLDRGKIDFYSGGKTFSFPFSPAFVKDLEVIDNDAFKTQLSAFIAKNSIGFGSCAIFLSESVCFISDPITKEQNQEDQLSSFLSSLPFESPVARVLGDKIVGTNKNLYQAIIEIVGQKGGKVKMISPIFLSKEMLGKKGIDDEVVDFISKNEEALFKATFTYDAPMPVQIVEQKNTQPKKSNKREIILIGVFAALLIGFIAWILIR